MWKSAYVGVYQLLNWKMHGETLKDFLFMSREFISRENGIVKFVPHVILLANYHKFRRTGRWLSSEMEQY